MSQNDKHPLHHSAPVHDASESQPGLDSLAPADGSHQPAPEPTPPGMQPTTSGSLKRLTSQVTNSTRWTVFAKEARILP